MHPSGRRLPAAARRGPPPGAPAATRRPDKVRSVSRQLQRLLARDRPPVAAGPKDPVQAASQAHLRYVNDDDPGLQRVKRGKTFHYLRPDGKEVKDRATLERIRKLVIPPAWTDVWICPRADGHIQATGRDVRGRKQYRYHQRWREVRDRTKFGRMIEFARTLPRIRRAVAADLRRPGMPREKLLATVVRLLELTSIRVGCDEYARQNRHFGLTTLLDQHVDVSGSKVRFHFTGKSGKKHDVDVKDPRLARIVHGCLEIPGQRLFQYVGEDGEPHPIDSGDVNDYLRSISGAEITAKDFRTWAGTNMVAAALALCGQADTAKAGKMRVIEAIDSAAARLGNTRSVCRSSYVHPAVIDAFMEGWLKSPPGKRHARPPRGLDALEVATLRVLEAAAQ
jgi:DNA topoisomerase-1